MIDNRRVKWFSHSTSTNDKSGQNFPSSLNCFWFILAKLSWLKATSHFDDGPCLSHWIMSSTRIRVWISHHTGTSKSNSKIWFEFIAFSVNISQCHCFYVIRYCFICFAYVQYSNWRQHQFQIGNRYFSSSHVNLVKFHAYH